MNRDWSEAKKDAAQAITAGHFQSNQKKEKEKNKQTKTVSAYQHHTAWVTLPVDCMKIVAFQPPPCLAS